MFYIRFCYWKNERIAHFLFYGERCEWTAQVAQRKWANRSFLGKKRAIHAENRWANSQPWKAETSVNFICMRDLTTLSNNTSRGTAIQWSFLLLAYSLKTIPRKSSPLLFLWEKCKILERVARPRPQTSYCRFEEQWRHLPFPLFQYNLSRVSNTHHQYPEIWNLYLRTFI